mgnify:CR=1 FL=1
MFFIKNEAFYASKNTFFEEISSAAQLSSAFSDRLPAQLRKKFPLLSSLSSAQFFPQLSSAQLFFSKFATLILSPKMILIILGLGTKKNFSRFDCLRLFYLFLPVF